MQFTFAGVSSRGGGGRAIASSLSQNDRIEAITRSRWTPQSAPFPDLFTFGPVVVCGVRFYRFVTASCGKKGYTQEKYADTTRFRSRGAPAKVSSGGPSKGCVQGTAGMADCTHLTLVCNTSQRHAILNNNGVALCIIPLVM